MKQKQFLMMITLILGFAVGALYPDSFEIMITPITYYSVQITTPSSGLSFENTNLNTEYVSNTSATVKNNGNVRADWTIKAVAINTWTLGTTLADNGLDRAVIAAKFNTTPPIPSEYVDNDVVDETEKNADSNNFAGNQNGDNVVKDDTRNLWIYIKTPTDTSVDTQQKFRIEIRAYPATRF